MTQPFKPNRQVTTYTYDSTDLRGVARHTTVLIYEKSRLALPVGERTSMVYEIDGHGSAVLREIIHPNGQVEKVPPPRASTPSPRFTRTFDKDGRVIDGSEAG